MVSPVAEQTAMVVFRLFAVFAYIMLLPVAAPAADTASGCRPLKYENARMVVCRYSLDGFEIAMHHRDPEGELIGTFYRLGALAGMDDLVFAMNGGMYSPSWDPVGLYVEDGQTIKRANTNDGYGNFHLKPNGVFYIQKDPQTSQLRAGVAVTEDFLAADIETVHATQSGPMLVIDGALHPRFLKDGTSKHRRNGVGVADDGRTVYFAISDTPVNFHTFASLFRDHLGVNNGLYLDGAVSKLHAKDLDRSDRGLPMGPIISVIDKR